MKVLIAIFVAMGFLVGLFNAIRMVFLLVAIGRWTDGSYHQPALTLVQAVGAAVCVPLAILAVVGTFKSRVRLGKQELLFVALVVAGAISSVALFWVHLEEADVTASGFRQAGYTITELGDLRFYNPSGEPVTVCLGTGTSCEANADGPAELRAPGLTLGGKETRLVIFPKPGSYRLTVAASGGSGDAVVTVVEKAEDSGPDLPS